jgi:hypothetical protein
MFFWCFLPPWIERMFGMVFGSQNSCFIKLIMFPTQIFQIAILGIPSPIPSKYATFFKIRVLRLWSKTQFLWVPGGSGVYHVYMYMFTHFPTRKTLDTSTCHAGDARHHDGAWETEGAGSSAVPWQGVLDLGMTGVTKICFALRTWDGWYKKHICTELVSPYVGFKRSGPWILDLHAFGSLNSFCFLRGKNQWGWWLNKCYLDGRRRHFGHILGWCTRWVWFRLQNHRLKGRMDQPIVDFGWNTPWFIEYWVTRIDLGESFKGNTPTFP